MKIPNLGYSQTNQDGSLVPCVIYIRVSTDEQAKEEHYSMAAQEDICMAEIKKREKDGWFHLVTLSDGGYSGFNKDRPGFLELLALVREKKVGVIVVYKRDRLFRNQELATQAQALFDISDIKVLSCVEGLAECSPHAVFSRQIIDSIAELERTNGRKRQHDILRWAASKGEWKGGIPPFGYSYDNSTRSLIIDDTRADLVREAFERVANGESAYQIALDWRKRGIRARGLKVHQTNPDKMPFIVPGAIERMVRLPIYNGIVRVRKLRTSLTAKTDKNPEWEEFEGRHRPLVSRELWYKANRALSEVQNRRSPPERTRGGKLISPLQGIIRCQCCDSSMAPGRSNENPSSGIRHRYYRCIRAVKGGSESGCTTGQVSAYALERAVIAILQGLETNPSMFPRTGADAELQRRAEERLELEREVQAVDLEITEKRRDLDNLVSYIRQGATALTAEANVAARSAKERLAQLEAKRVKVGAAISLLAAKIPLASDIARQAGLIAAAVSVAALEPQHTIFRNLIKTILVRRVVISNNGATKRRSPQRTFRLTLRMDSNYLLRFGRNEMPFELKMNGFAETIISVVLQIISTHHSQRIVLLEQGITTLSADYKKLRDAEAPTSAVPAPIEPRNPIQRAIRWRAQIESTGVSLTGLAESEKVTKGLVSQHLKLLSLPQVIVDFLKEGRDVSMARKFSLRELQRFSEMPIDQAVEQFQQRVRGSPVQATLTLG